MTAQLHHHVDLSFRLRLTNDGFSMVSHFHQFVEDSWRVVYVPESVVDVLKRGVPCICELDKRLPRGLAVSATQAFERPQLDRHVEAEIELSQNVVAIAEGDKLTSVTLLNIITKTVHTCEYNIQKV